MTPELIKNYLRSNYQDVIDKTTWGETSFFVNPDLILPSGTYFATIKESDGPNDRASNLDRPGIFRLNIGVGRVPFEEIFGQPPQRPAKGEIIKGPWNFTATNQVIPHPVYGWMSWICVVNPDKAIFDTLIPLLNAAYAKSRNACLKRIAKLEWDNT